VTVLKFNSSGKYIGFLIIISFITLVSIKLTNSNNIEHKPRVFIESIEKAYISNSKDDVRNEGVRVPITNGNSGVQLLPIPATNSPIIITPLSSEKL